MTTTKAKLLAVSLDCAEPKKLAEFYHQVTGFDIQYSVEEYAAVSDGTTSIYFGRVAERKPVVWPSPDKQFHLDFDVDDLDEGEAKVVALGATRAETQPGESFRVFLDPAGYPFCLCVG